MFSFSWMVSTAAGALMGAMLVYPREAAAAALGALTAFTAGVLPGLLPFAACALLLTAGHALPAPLLTALALPGGSPTGARLFRDAALTPAQARHAAACTGVMSPMFFLYTLGEWLGSPAAGRLLLAVHLAAALLCGLFFRPGPRGRIALPPLSVSQAVAQAGQAMVTAAACVALGAAAARMLRCALPGLPPIALAVLQGMLEITVGAKALAALAAPLPLIAALTAFTGFAILLQNAAFWQKNGLTAGDLFGIALLRAALAWLLCRLAMVLCAV